MVQICPVLAGKIVTTADERRIALGRAAGSGKPSA